MTYVHVEGVMIGMLSWVVRLNRLDYIVRLCRVGCVPRLGGLSWVARLPLVPKYLLFQPSYLPFLTYLHLFSTYLPTL
jgi:hypothetical protein